MPLFLGALLGLGGLIGSAFSGASKARQQGRADESQLLLQRDRNRLLGGQLDLAQRGFQESAPQGRLGQASRADIVGNINTALDARQPRVAKVGDRNVTSFGLDPSLLFRQSGTTQDLAGLVAQRALAAQQAGDQFQPFQHSPLPQPSGFDTFLNIGAGVGAGLQGVNEFLNRRGSNRERVLEEVTSGDNTFLLPRG